MSGLRLPADVAATHNTMSAGKPIGKTRFRPPSPENLRAAVDNATLASPDANQAR